MNDKLVPLTMGTIYFSKAEWLALEIAGFTRQTIREVILRSGYEELDRLLSQKENEKQIEEDPIL